MNAPELEIINNTNASQFEFHQDDQIGVLKYAQSGDVLRLIHTEVPASLRGNGYASQLAHAALEYARQEHLRVVPVCPFVRAYVKRHPEYALLISSGMPSDVV